MFGFLFSSREKRKLARKNMAACTGMDHDIALEPLLSEYIKKTVRKTIPLERIDLMLVSKTDIFRRSRYWSHRNIWRICKIDAPYHMVLTYDSPSGARFDLALIGFRISGSSVLIEQVQGMNKKCEEAEAREILNSLRWEKLLISAVEEWAKRNGFKKVKILKSRYNPWAEKYRPNLLGLRELSGGKRNQILKMHYDVTAKRMKYKEGRRRYWIKVIA